MQSRANTRASDLKELLQGHVLETCQRIDSDAAQMISNLEELSCNIEAVDPLLPLDVSTPAGRVIANALTFVSDYTLQTVFPITDLCEYLPIIDSGVMLMPKLNINVRQHYVNFRH